MALKSDRKHPVDPVLDRGSEHEDPEVGVAFRDMSTSRRPESRLVVDLDSIGHLGLRLGHHPGPDLGLDLVIGAVSDLELTVPSRLHGSSLRGVVYNGVLVRGFNLLPRRIVRNFGWHIIAFATKAGGAPS